MPKKIRYKKPTKQVEIARKRISFLFREASSVFKNNPALADSHVKTARKLAMKFKIKLSSQMKRKFCKNCYRLLVPGINTRVRLHKHRLIYYCQNCRNHTRLSIK